MTKGSCDPSPEPFNFYVISKDNGRVTFTCRYGAGGVYPNCTGAIHDVRVQNTGPNTWIVAVPNSLTQKTQPLAPGTDRTFTGQQLEGIGLTQAQHLNGITLDPAP